MAYTTTRKRRAPARRKTVARRKRRNPRFGRHRPVLEFQPRGRRGGGWRRPRTKTGKIASMISPKKRTVRINRKRRKTRLNPFTSASAKRAAYKRWYGTRRRARRNGSAMMRTRRNPYMRRNRRRYRRNPNGFIKTLTSQQMLFTGLKIGGGIVAGSMAMPIVNRIVPEENREKWDRYYGAFHLVIGALLFSMIRNRNVKEIGLVIAGTGVYDLIASNFPKWGLTPLPRSLPIIDELLEAKPPTNGTMGLNYRLPVRSGYGMSYETGLRPVSAVAAMGTGNGMGLSYQARGAFSGDFSDDDPFASIEG